MTLRCDLCVARTSDGYVVRVQGKGTSAHSPSLAEFVKGCLTANSQDSVAVDLLGCEYLDSTFLGCLLKLQQTGTAKRFQVIADDAARKRLLTATGLDKFLTISSREPKSSCTFLKLDAAELSPRELGKHMMETHAALAEVPSASSSVFQRIASQLATELEMDEPDDEPNLFDTVIVTPPPRP